MSEFTRGPFGELLLPPLVAGVTAEDIWTWFADRVGREEAEALRVQRGSDSALVLAMAAYHSHRLAQVVGGDARTPDEERVRDAVLGREPISLRPITLEGSDPSGFAPIFQYLGDDRWRVGKEGMGKMEVFEEPDHEAAVRRAHRVYVEWQG
jgi:hypothetical protein